MYSCPLNATPCPRHRSHTCMVWSSNFYRWACPRLPAEPAGQAPLPCLPWPGPATSSGGPVPASQLNLLARHCSHALYDGAVLLTPVGPALLGDHAAPELLQAPPVEKEASPACPAVILRGHVPLGSLGLGVPHHQPGDFRTHYLKLPARNTEKHLIS